VLEVAVAAAACAGTAIAGAGDVRVIRVPDRQGSGHTVQACWRPTGRRRLVGDVWTVEGRGYSRVKFVRVSGRFAAGETTWHEDPFRELPGEHTVRIVVVDVKSGKRRAVDGDVHDRLTLSRSGTVRWTERKAGRVVVRTSSAR
jgi:hypothetical protein